MLSPAAGWVKMMMEHCGVGRGTGGHRRKEPGALHHCQQSGTPSLEYHRDEKQPLLYIFEGPLVTTE